VQQEFQQEGRSSCVMVLEDRDRCLEAGANEYWTKAVKLRDLFLNIQRLLSSLCIVKLGDQR
jgi:CheY-like chemotaxis protein